MNSVRDSVVSDPVTGEIPSNAVARCPGILVVDDMVLILKILHLALAPRGFVVWLATGGDDALDLYRHNHAEIDLLLLDVQMPGRDGPQTLAAAQRINPEVAACYMTGHPGKYTYADLLDSGATCVCDKPFRVTELVQSLDDILQAQRSSTPSGRTIRPRRRSHASYPAH